MTAISEQLRIESSDSGPVAWLVVMQRELKDLWLTWRAPILVIAASALLSVLTYLAATNQELNLLDQKDTVSLVMQVTLAVGVAISLLVTADAISGERERGTLESLLLAPVLPRVLILGKLLAAMSIWPVMTAVAVPYVWVLRAGNQVAGDAIASGILVGFLLAATFCALGILVSMFSTSNRVSLAVAFFILIALTVPTQLPGAATAGWFGRLITHVNPMTAGSQFIKQVTVSDSPWSQEIDWLISPLVCAAALPLAALILAARLRLQGGFSG